MFRQMVEGGWPEPGSTAYVSRPGTGPGLGLLVVHELWGLVPEVRSVCDRFALEGFVALAPDLYGGATTEEHDPARAEELRSKLDTGQVLASLSRWAAYLEELPVVVSQGVGVVGFCMGGGFALMLSAQEKVVRAAVSFYPVIKKIERIDLSTVRVPTQVHLADHDDMVELTAADVETGLRAAGVDFEILEYPDTRHGFINEIRPEVFDPIATRKAWRKVLRFLHARLR